MNDIVRKRWDKSDGKPASHSPTEAVEVLLYRLKSGELNPAHLIIVYSDDEDSQKGSTTGYMQAGSFKTFAQVGLLTEIILLMRDPPHG
jgi:hypothetical protein